MPWTDMNGSCTSKFKSWIWFSSLIQKNKKKKQTVMILMHVFWTKHYDCIFKAINVLLPFMPIAVSQIILLWLRKASIHHLYSVRNWKRSNYKINFPLSVHLAHTQKKQTNKKKEIWECMCLHMHACVYTVYCNCEKKGLSLILHRLASGDTH